MGQNDYRSLNLHHKHHSVKSRFRSKANSLMTITTIIIKDFVNNVLAHKLSYIIINIAIIKFNYFAVIGYFRMILNYLSSPHSIV